MAMQTGGGSAEATPYINITPLIDVLLVLLIIFMVVSPLKPSRFEAKVPAEPKDKENQQVKPNPLSLVVDVDQEGKIRLNKEEQVDAGALGAKLSEIFETRTRNGVFKEGSTTNEIEKTVFVKAPKALKYGEVVRVIDSVKGAGATPIGLQIDDLQ
jgi:biopolymer transport protein ExbD